MVAANARPEHPGYLPALTGLRFFLALWVIVNHLVGTGHVYEPVVLRLPGPLQAIARGGYLAVPTFFVLSGFVLGRTYAATQWNPANLRKYLAGRFARVYPVYFLSLLIVLPFIVKAKDQPKGLARGDAPDPYPGVVDRPLYGWLEHAGLVSIRARFSFI